MRKAQDLLLEYAKRIAERYPESTVLLFGSRARGDHLPYSDYDVAVVLRKVGDKLLIIEEIRRLKPRGLPVDLVVLEESELTDPLVSKTLSRAKPLYDGLGLLRS